MKNTLKRLLCLLLALCMCAGLALGAAAGNDPPEGGESKVSMIEIDSTDVEKPIYVGDEFILSCVTVPDNYSGSVTWSTESNLVEITPSGRSCKVKAVDEGNAAITVTVDEDGTKTDTFEFIIVPNTVSDFYIEGDNFKNGEVNFSGTGTFTLTAVTEFANSDVKRDTPWNIWAFENGGLSVISVSDGGVFTVKGPGDTKITATCPYDDSQSVEIYVHIANVPMTGLSISGTGVTGINSPYSASVSAGNTLSLTAKKQPENTFDGNPITWSSSDTSVATVSAGVVTAVKEGKATITASCGGAAASVEVTVSAASSNKSVSGITGSTTRSKNLSFSSIYSDLRSRYNGQYNKNPSDSAKIVFSSPLGSSSVGRLYESSSGAKAIAAGTAYTLSNLYNFYFIPSAAGKYELSYTLTETENNSTKSISGKITITVTDAKADITITLSDDSQAYAFSTTSNLERTKAATLIGDAVKAANGSSSYSYIVFGRPSSSSNAVGTLYANSSEKSLSTYNSYTYKSGTGSIDNLYFVPKLDGTYSIPYTAYNSSNIELCSGNLIIEVGDDNSTVTVTLDDDYVYTFSEKTRKDKTSAATAIYDTIYDKTGKTYSYIKFGSIVSGSSVGTLYTDSYRTAIKTTAQYNYSATSGYEVSDLYFVPEKAGTYVRSFTAYSSGGIQLMAGTLKIVVPSEGGSEMDIYFNTTTGGTVSLDENVFESWYRQQKGSSYKLAYVTFDGANHSFGSFKHSNSSFTPGNDVKYFAEGYTGSTGSNARYLDNVEYTAPNATGYVSVDFTCYGGASASLSGTKVSGTFFIFVTSSSVKGISRDVKYGSAVTLSENEFSSVHRSAMSLSSTASPRYYIELLEIPSKGTLYCNYTSAGKPGTRLTGSNFDDYKFYVNSGSVYDTVADLTYVPANSSSGTDSVRYLARSTSGEPMYVGSLSFIYGRKQGASISCGADGYTFKTSDFYYSGDSDPVAYVTFIQPDSGELMLGYSNGRGVPLDSSVRLYTGKSANGSYPITSLSYIPKAGFSGDVDVYYTAVTEAGKAQSGVLTIKVASRKGSAHFKDVQSTGSGAWASDAIDFAYKWGLVNGTGADTFSPDNTMTRAMLVTILYRSAGSPKVSGSCPFKDVAAGTYYYDAVIWAASNGIVTGTSATTFSPDRDVNREQVAAFLHRYAKYNGKNVTVTGTLNGYSDKSFVSQYAIEPVTWAVQHGYITSTSGTELLISPGGSATRAQVAVMLHRFLTY